MALISIKVPAECFSSVGKIDDPSHLHVTLAYLGDNVRPVDILCAVAAVSDVCCSFKPFQLSSNYTSFFSPSKHGFPIICPVDSVELHDLRERVISSLRKRRVPFMNNFLAYRPHVTLFYSNFLVPSKPIHPPALWTCDHIQVWPNDKGSEGQITIPFTSR